MEVSVIRTLDQLNILQPYWESVQKHPNTDFGHYRLVCQFRADAVRPYVVVLGKLDWPSGLLVCRLERRTVALSIGYLRTLEIPATVLTGLYKGLLGEPGERETTILLRHLWQALRSGEADAVELYHLADTSPLLAQFLASAPRFWSEKNVRWSAHWSLTVPTDGGGLTRQMSSKHRRWMRKKERELEEAFPGAVAWRWIRSFDALPDLCARLERLAARTYQRGLGAGFQNDDENRERWALFASRDELRLQVLEIDGEIRAFWFGSVYKGVFHSWATAYDPDLRAHEPGNLLFHRMIDELAREGVRKLDFGLGDAFYKQRFGGESWKEATVRLFAPTARGAMLRAGVGISTTLESAGRRLVETTGLTPRLKSLWRQHLARQPTPRNGSRDRPVR